MDRCTSLSVDRCVSGQVCWCVGGQHIHYQVRWWTDALVHYWTGIYYQIRLCVHGGMVNTSATSARKRVLVSVGAEAWGFGMVRFLKM